MNERDLFLSALEIEDSAARKAHLESACADDADLLIRVESLLASHDGESQFLQTPVGEQLGNEPAGQTDATLVIGTNSTQDKSPDGSPDASILDFSPHQERSKMADETPLGYLEPSTKPDSLGRLAHYEILEVVGSGAFGTVLRAFDDKLQRVVAIKVMAPELASTSPARKRFIREAQASAQIRHENVVSVYAVEEKPIPYLVMEYIPGVTLQQRLDEKGPLDVLTVLRLGTQIAEGLAAAHAKDLIHRDIKPGNILLESGMRDRVKITDFGLARAADDASMTQSGTIAGTPMYMAPEQALGHKLDQRADLFSFGSVLYQMVSGRPPFRASSTLAVLKRLTEETPRPIQEIIPETPTWLCDIITKLHAKNPDERYQSAREVADVLANCESQLKEHSRLKDLSLIPRAKPQPAGWWKWVAVAALVLPLLAIGLYAFIRPGSQPKVTGNGNVEPTIPDPIKPVATAQSSPVTIPVVPVTDGWVQLFNGKDLTGWKTHPEQRGDWEVKDGILIGSKVASYLFSDGSKFENFHLRIQAKINRGGDSGIFFRSPFTMRPGRTADSLRPAGGYEAELHRNPAYQMPIGSIWNAENAGIPKLLRKAADLSLTEVDEWFTLEIIARGNHLVTKVNGTQTAECDDPGSRFHAGCIALQVLNPQTIVQFRKIEIRELPASSEPLPPTYKNTLGMEFVIVPKGKSWLGGGNGKLGDNEVMISADFYLGKYEVTQEEWEKVMGENPSHFSRIGGGQDAVKDISDADLKRFPVEYVSWDQCQSFVAKLNERVKETGWVYRLPTLVEWEHACRGGGRRPALEYGFDYYFDQPTNTLLPDQSNFKSGEKALNRTCMVGSYKPNRLGLYDMHGNVWEWCLDELKDDKGASRRRPLGGCFWDDSKICRAGFRRTGHPSSHRHQTLGLRLARVPSGTPSPEAKTPPVAVAPFTDADVKRIAALPAAEQVEEVRKELMRRNPGLDGTATHKIEDGVVTEFVFTPIKGQDVLMDISPARALVGLTYLNLWSCSGLEDLEPLKGLKLTRLIIGSLTVSLQLRDLEPLRGMKLTELQLYRCQVQDLEPLRDMPLTRLTLFSSQIRDCEPLKGMPLTTLRLANCTQIQDFTPLAGLPLTSLTLNDCRVRDLEPFKGMKLTRLDLVGTPVRDLELLKGMPLKTLSIFQKPGVTDLRPLQGLELEEIHLTPKNITKGLDILRDMPSLKTIGIGYGQAWPPAEFWERYDKGEFAAAPFTDAEVQRIAALPAAEQVEEIRKELMGRNPGFDGTLKPTIENDVVTELSINSDEIIDIAPVRALTGLIYLDCRGTYPNKGKLSDLSPLKGMKLSHIDCSSTQIADLAPLADMPLTNLQFNHNPVSDLTPLKNMPLDYLGCAETKVSDFSPLKGLKLKVLGAQLLPVTDLSPLQGMPLTGLDLYGTRGVTSLEPLQGMPLDGLNLQDLPVSDLSPLKGMTTLRTLLLQGNKVSDLSPLAGLKLTTLLVHDKAITDLSPLKGIPLIRLEINGSGVSDLRPLQGMPLRILRLTPQNITQGIDVLRDIKSLEIIGIDSDKAWPPAEFWERYDKGEFKE
ncbi:MAG: protein kinase [Planctomycetales bacterium]|nr:protein kinase [Planctomycetales bacterium]